MVNRRAGMRGVLILGWLGAGALLYAQPSISSVTSSAGLSSLCPGPTNGTAITAGTVTQSQSICIYINGAFTITAGVTNTPTWTPQTSSPTAQNLDVYSETTTEIIAIVPQNLYATAGSALVGVTQTFSSVNTYSNTETFTINAAVAGVGALPNGYVGVPYSQAAFTGGTPPFTFQGTQAAPGLTLSTANGNLLTGTPTTAGFFNVTSTITDSWGNVYTLADNIDIFSQLQIVTSSLPNGVINAAYPSTQLTGSGGESPYTWNVTGLPTGLNVNPATGVLSGTPTQSGTFTANITLTDGSEQTATAHIGFTIYTALTITTSSLPNGVINTAYPSTTLTGTGGITPYTWTATGLPTGLNLNPTTGVLSGTPTLSGTFTANITLTDSSSQTATAHIGFTIYAALVITTATLPNGTVNTAYPSTTLTGTGGATPYTWTATGLPSGLGLNPNTGVLSGTPTQSGTFTANVTLRDSSSQTATAQFGFVISSSLRITTTSLPNDVINTPYPSTTLTESGGITPLYWSATGLPPGLTLNPGTGVLSGTPTQSGSFTPTVTLTDYSEQTTTAQFTLVVYSPLTITTIGLPNGLLNTAYPSTTLTGSGGASPYTWTATGLPAGLTLNPNTGVLSGTPTQSGAFTANVTLRDSSSQTATAQFAFNIYSTLTITTTSLPSGVVNRAYSTTLTGTGGAMPYNWTATGLPPGLTLNANSGVLSGTPTQTGSFTANVTLTDAINGDIAPAQLPISIYNALAITTSSLPNGRINTAYPNTTLTGTGGATPYTWTATGLPTGLTLNPTTGVLSGTPTQSGAFTASITLKDSGSQTATAQFPFTISAILVITTASVPNGRVNTAYTSTTLTASGGVAPFNWSATGLPLGLTLSPSTGVLSGTPTQSGAFTANVTLTDSSSQTATAQFPFTVFATLGIITNSLPAGRINLAYTTTLTGSGGATPYTWTATGLPTGLTLNPATGVLSGTPTQAGTFTVTVTLTDTKSAETYIGAQTAQVTYSLLIVPTLIILTTSLPSNVVGSPYTATLLGSGGLQPYVWAATGLPTGLSLNTATGVISGTPTQTGSSIIAITLTDSSGQTAKTTFTPTILPIPVTAVQIVTTSLPNASVGVFYSGTIVATGGNGGPYTFTVTGGGLPPAMQVSSNGLLQGTPTTPGNFSFTVSAADSAGNSGSGAVAITVGAAPLAITTGALNNVPAGSPVSVVFTATGGVPALTFSLSGTAPPGMSFSSNGTLSGTPTTAGTYSFTITVTDSAKNTASKSFTLIVTQAPLVITASLPAGQAGVAYAGQFSATGGTPPYTWSGSAGGSLSVSSTGAVTGTPATAGTFTVSVTVMDSLGVKASGSFSVTVTASNLIITTSSLSGGTVGSAYSATLNATGGTPPYTWSAAGLPAGISASSSGILSGTPTSPGAFTVSVTVKDSAGVSVTASLGLTILSSPLQITTTGIPTQTLGSSFSFAFGVTGGSPPYTWSAAGLPAGMTITSAGTLSGLPGAPGTFSISVSVVDNNGLKASSTFSLTVTLPPTPTVTLTGLPSTANPATQSTATVTFNVAYPLAVTLNLTLTFTPLSGADDPNIQFSTGGRTATLTIPAGSTSSSSTIGVQTGTVAGTITITTQLIAAGNNITPSPAPTKTIVIGPAAPTITSVTAATNGTGFTVTIDGFDPTRAVTQATFTFTPAAGSTLQTTTVTIPATSLFSAWYGSSASTPFGSQFSFIIPFTVTGNVQGIASVTVTLANPTGTSNSVSAII